MRIITVISVARVDEKPSTNDEAVWKSDNSLHTFVVVNSLGATGNVLAILALTVSQIPSYAYTSHSFSVRRKEGSEWRVTSAAL